MTGRGEIAIVAVVYAIAESLQLVEVRLGEEWGRRRGWAADNWTPHLAPA